MFIAQAERKPVDLGLGHDLDRVLGDQVPVRRPAEEIADAGKKIPHIGFLEGVFERQHRPRMGDFGEAGGRRGPDPPRRAVGAYQLGKMNFDLGIAAAQCVVIGIGNLRRGFGVVEPIVPADLLGQRGQLVAGLFLGQLIDGSRFGLRRGLARRSCVGASDQARGGGSRLDGHGAAGQHPGDFLLSRIRIELLDAGHGLTFGEAAWRHANDGRRAPRPAANGSRRGPAGWCRAAAIARPPRRRRRRRCRCRPRRRSVSAPKRCRPAPVSRPA